MNQEIRLSINKSYLTIHILCIKHHLSTKRFIKHPQIREKGANLLYFLVMDDFQTWVNSEVGTRGWSFNTLAERMGLTSSAVSKVMLGQNRLTFDFCLKLSNAFEIAPEKVFRLAGLLPNNNENNMLQELIDIAGVLDNEELQLVLGFAQWRYSESRGDK